MGGGGRHGAHQSQEGTSLETATAAKLVEYSCHDQATSLSPGTGCSTAAAS